MSEPITLYRDGETLTVTAPSWAKELQAQGWTTEPEADDVPFSFAPVVEDEPAVEHVPVVPVKRGRPRKAQK